MFKEFMGEGEPPATVEELDVTELTPIRRRANEMLMVAWIHRDLPARAGYDVHQSIAFYDAEKDFVYATDTVPSDAVLRELRVATGIRFWSKGV